ncbi:MAG: amino acid racemase [Rhodospirillaceae bacterium]|nr:amino acid racemase [Rhodospirillaceae bacterium]
MAMQRRLIGVLGGMGPLATVDFMGKVIAATAADCDQEHIPMIVHAVPQIPDRTEAITNGTDGPFPNLLRGLRTLERCGADLVVVPCNTAHAWFDRLAASTDVRMLHIAEAVRGHLDGQLQSEPESIGLLATSGTIRAGFYQRYLHTEARRIIVPPPPMQDDISAAISAVKGGYVAQARELAARAGAALFDVGVTRLLLACTELPIAFKGSIMETSCIDATACLAAASVAFSIGGDSQLPQSWLISSNSSEAMNGLPMAPGLSESG